ncbi:MAG TPA: carboxypeptidase-like regulatory domain-containing protein, partial [Thermoanaerobaculia bacterium]
MLRPIALLLALIVASGALDAGAVPVHVQLTRASSEPAVVDLSAVLAAGSTASAATPVIMQCGAPGVCTLDLTPGVWLLRSDTPHLYVSQKPVAVQSSPVTVEVAVRETSVVTLNESGDAAQVATMHFTSDAGEDAVPCTKELAIWSCRVPRGTWDLQFRARGFASHSFVAVAIGADAKSLGAIKLRKGASLVGQVADIGDRRSAKPAEVSLIRAASGAKAAAPVTTFADARGRFQFTGVAPGDYRVTARCGTRQSNPVTVTVIADREAVLRNALVLSDLLAINVTISDLSARDVPWTVQLARVDGHDHAEVVDRKPARSGIVQFSALSGTYAVSIEDQSRARWARRTIEVASENVELAFLVSPQRVEGRVRIGEKGIPAELTFQNGASGSLLRTTSDGEGVFALSLPELSESEPWLVEVASRELGLKRTITDARFRTDAEGVAHVDLELPVTRLTGRVVDAAGAPVKRGFVNVAA